MAASNNFKPADEGCLIFFQQIAGIFSSRVRSIHAAFSPMICAMEIDQTSAWRI